MGLVLDAVALWDCRHISISAVRAHLFGVVAVRGKGKGRGLPTR